MKKEKLKLHHVTLTAMTSVKLYETIRALCYSMRDIEFGEVVLITDKKPFYLPRGITYKHTEKLEHIDQFNYKMAYEMGDYIDTDYMLLIHYDGFVVNADKWQEDFLKYDYIGSPWPLPTAEHATYYDVNGNLCRVGNSVSLRSKRLLEFPKKAQLEWKPAADGFYNEDIFLCCMNKHLIEQAGMKIAPIEVARFFGHEHPLPETEGMEPFVFHKWWGPNAQYPHFENPCSKLVRKGKDLIRPLLFWRN